MNLKRRLLLATLLATSPLTPADAGCLDCLFGNPAQPVYPYVAGYTPTTAVPVGPPTIVGTSVAPYAAGYAPYVAGYTPYTGGSAYAAGYGSLPSAVASQLPTYPQSPTYGAVPSYGVAVGNVAPATAYSLPYNNPSVLTGQPVGQAVQTSYFNAPVAAPTAIAPAMQSPGWFGRMFGNTYQTTYNNVPTTTFRPVNQIDPATGQVVTVQQPCTSLTQQVQRTPYTSLQPAVAPVTPYYGEPVCGSEPPRYAPPTSYGAQPVYGAQQNYAPQAAYAPQSSYPPAAAYAPPSAVSQATAIAPSNATAYGQPAYAQQPLSNPGCATPIPATSPYGLSQANTQPLTGYPGSQPSSGDAAPLSPPQLDANRPAWSSPSVPSNTGGSPYYTPALPSTSNPSTAYPSNSLPSTNGALQAPLLPSTSSWPNRPETNTSDNFTRSQTNPGAESTRDKYSHIAPIPAPDDYRAPAWTDQYSKPNATTVDSGRDHFGDRVPASTSLSEPRTASSNSSTSDGSLRYASSPSNLPPLPPASPARQAPPRDESRWFAVEPR